MTMLNTEQAAKYLFGEDGKPNTLHQWRFKGRGPKFRKIGRLVRYVQSDLDEYIEAGTQTPGRPPNTNPTNNVSHIPR